MRMDRNIEWIATEQEPQKSGFGMWDSPPPLQDWGMRRTAGICVAAVAVAVVVVVAAAAVAAGG